MADHRKAIVRHARETIGQTTALLMSIDQLLDQNGTFPIHVLDVSDLVHRLNSLHAQHILLGCIEECIEVDSHRRVRKKS